MKQQLQLAAFCYLLLVAAAFVYLAWMKKRVRTIDSDLGNVQPQVAFIVAQEARWATLQPAIDPERYTVHVLKLCQEARPSNELQFTVFEHQPTQFIIEGEAPSANVAIEYGEKLKAVPGLSEFKIDTPPPQVLKDDRWRFKFTGHL